MPDAADEFAIKRSCSRMGAMWGRVVIAMLLLCIASPTIKLAADESSPENEQDLQALLQVVSQETDIATRTNMNRDYVPGMITVLDGDTLEALGCRNVLDALSLVPGVQTFRDFNAVPNLSVRGIAYPFNTGNMKVLINSVAMSREDAGLNSSALLTPIEQVDRIEVVRGPSSSLHGGFAFAGLINIVTRDQEKRVFTGGNGDGFFAGVNVASTINKWHFAVSTAPTKLLDNEGPIGTNPDADNTTSIVEATHNGLSLKAQNLRRNQDMTVPNSGLVDSYERSTALEAKQQFTISPKLQGEVHASYLNNRFVSIIVGKNFRGGAFDSAASLMWTPGHHSILTEVEFNQSHIDHALLRFPPIPSVPPLVLADIDDTNRYVTSLTLQDQMNLGERVAVTLGLRVDHHSDVGTKVTPRAAIVFRANDRHILKAQYSEGFRPPTFWELYAPGYRNPDLGFEIMRTAEFGYVYHPADTVVRLTVFDSHIDDLLFIVLPPPGPGPTIFENNTKARMDGFELEAERKETERFRWLGNVSFVNTNDTRSTSGPDGDSAAAADWLGNLAGIYRPFSSTILAARWLHVGKRHTVAGLADGYDTVDLTSSVALNSNWTIRGGVRNVFNDSVTHLIALPNFTEVDDYATRNVWLTLLYRF